MRPAPRNLALKLSTLIVATACFAVMSTGLVLSKNFRKMITLWGESVQLTVYLSQDNSVEGTEHIQKLLKASPEVETVRFITQEKALSDFRVQLASYAPDLTQDEELLQLIPASLEVSLKSSVPAGEQLGLLSNLASQVKNLEGVDEVSYGQEWVSKYSALVSAFEIVLNLLGLVILAASVFVMSNAIRASVSSRKDEIIVMEMIGATQAMVRKPFIAEGAILGALSSAFAIVLSFMLYTLMKNVLQGRLSFLQLSEHMAFLSVMGVLGFVLCGTLLGAFGSYLCVRRVNDGWAGSQG